MAVTYGFFNSVNGDRKYNAEQMSEYFRGIINEGVYQHLDGGLAVTAGTGLAVNVAAGRAIIQNRWIQNSAAMSLTIAAASETYARKDAVVIRLNWSSRSISIAVKTGTPAASPVAPSMTRNSTTYEMALAYVNVAANATSVTVTDKRSDSTVCGWVTVAQSTSGEVDAMLNAMKTGFDGVGYDSPAAMVQGSDEFLYKQINDFNLYNAISTKSKFGGDLYPGDIILVNYTGGTYNYKWVDLNLSAGDYTIVVGHIDFSPVGSLKIKNAVVGTNILNITSSGAYKFTVSAGYSGTNGILFQVSEGSETTSGIYGAYNIHIFSGDVTKAPVFANDVIGKRPPAKKISKHFDSVSGYEGGNIQVGNSKQNNTIGFYGKFTGTFNGIQIMHGVNKPYASGVVQVYSDRIEVYKHTNAQTLIATYQHGLTLSTFIELKINVLEDQKATITLGTLGGVYHVDNVEFDGCYNSIAWNTITTAMTDCEISYSDNDKNKEIWLFGDSYMDHYPVYMHEYGADNFALDGFSGRTSTEALYSLNIALQNCPIPKYLIWALGMNDRDTGGTVNANWKSVFDTVKSYCDMYEIELIPVTVPNTPTVDNSYKNAVIRSSGLRYVDLSDAVGAEESTSWYTGLLSGDNVHATPQGRKVMALRMMADVPELV